jgi:hypothetical protein
MSQRGGAHCPTCGLTLTPRSPILLPRHCPRCVVRRRLLVELEACTIGAQPPVPAIVPTPADRPILPRVGGRS